MKLFELHLKENQMYINPKSYGSWVDTVNAKVYPVSDFAHAKFVQENLNLFNKDNLSIDDFGGEPYALAFYNGFVRLAHEVGHNYLDIQGLKPDIAKIKRLIVDVAEVEGRPELNIDVVRPFQPTNVGTNQPPPSKDEYYNLNDIKDKRALNQFFRAA